jgi:hypothetical protein
MEGVFIIGLKQFPGMVPGNGISFSHGASLIKKAGKENTPDPVSSSAEGVSPAFTLSGKANHDAL